ncbi:hypothetical protein JJJA_0026 [Achromobacter phage JWDelta]|uniref:Uncharacterized protein n=1 Tax=Achromobacter phage JWDelta TaxID=1416008 RepID=V9SJ62_9CAUD|nr:hypothetical protein JJJA_0026 [Achromobacter phage JWDelta]
MSNHNDKRSPSTDALETLGMIHFKPEHRDAIHLAVEPVIAGEELKPGQHIGMVDGFAFGKAPNLVRLVGIVDPFLPRNVKQGEKFWLVIYPRMVTSLRHVWEHPDFPEGT